MFPSNQRILSWYHLWHLPTVTYEPVHPKSYTTASQVAAYSHPFPITLKIFFATQDGG